MATEAGLQDQAVNINPIPLHFGITLKADWCATGQANIVVKTPGNDNQGWAITTLPRSLAINYALSLNSIAKEILPNENLFQPNFVPETIRSEQFSIGNQIVGIDTCQLIWRVVPEAWTPVESNIQNEETIPAVILSNLLNKQNLVLSLGITANNR